MSDWQLFWHEHYRHPLVKGGSTGMGTGFTATMQDDGTVVYEDFDIREKISKLMDDAIVEIRTYRPNQDDELPFL